MRNITVFTAIFLTLSLLSCQDTKESAQQIHPAAAFYKTIGHQISLETGERWIEANQIRNTNLGRTDSATFAVGGAVLGQMLNSVNDLNGVAFQYGLDDHGNKHIILIPVSSSLSLWPILGGRILIDANSGTELREDVAKSWALSYQFANPTDIWFHYFGKNVFDEILATSALSQLEIVPAINDADLSPQLLLVIQNDTTTQLSSGRTYSDDTTIYDASYPCPKCQVQ